MGISWYCVCTRTSSREIATPSARDDMVTFSWSIFSDRAIIQPGREGHDPPLLMERMYLHQVRPCAILIIRNEVTQMVRLRISF